LHFTALEKNGRDPLGLKQTTIDALEDVARLSQMPAPVLTTTAPRTAPIDQTREPPALKEEPASDQSHVDEDEEAYAALKNDLSAPMGRDEVALVRGAHRITIRIGTAGAFAPASAELTASAHELIARIQRITFAGHPDVVVSGHTDNVPISTQRYHDNWELASARALAVVRELQGAQNVPLGSLVAASYADTRPLVPNDSPENRERNRRVEIELHYR
jgi:chemotaxis protein MotB